VKAKRPVLPDLAKARVLVAGDVMLDRYWFGDVSRISPEAPVPVVRIQIERTEERPGGAANVARNCAALGAKVSLLSVVGADEPGETLARLVEAEGVRASLYRDGALATTVKLRVMSFPRPQQLLRIDFETSPSHEVLGEKLAEFEGSLSDYDVVVLSDYGKGGLAHIERMITLARAAGKPVLVDPKGDDYSRYQGASVLTPNLSELEKVVGRWKDEADLTGRAEKLRELLGLDALLLTRGGEGMTLYRADGVRTVPARKRDVADVTGAGDTVVATLAVMLGAGANLPEAVRVANHAGGIVVGKLGTAVVQPAELAADLAAA
jgi:D-glycero-beta-D-manno-heptose-7-phosphate kinase